MHKKNVLFILLLQLFDCVLILFLKIYGFFQRINKYRELLKTTSFGLETENRLMEILRIY